MPDGQQHQQARRRTADPDEVDGPARCKQRYRQRSAELDGHRNAERNRFQRQVEQHVHHAQRHAVTRHHPPVMARHAVPPRASEQDQHQGREQQPQCRGALRAHNGEDLLGQRGAQRQRRHRAQQPQDGLQGKGRGCVCRRLGRSSRRIHDGEGRIRERGRAHAWGDEVAAPLMGSRKAAACAVPRDRGTGERCAEDPHGSARRSPACARNVRKPFHDKEDDADPVRRRPVARPSSGECCRSDDTRSSVLPFFTDGSDVAHSRLPDVPGEGAASVPRWPWLLGRRAEIIVQCAPCGRSSVGRAPASQA